MQAMLRASHCRGGWLRRPTKLRNVYTPKVRSLQNKISQGQVSVRNGIGGGGAGVELCSIQWFVDQR